MKKTINKWIGGVFILILFGSLRTHASNEKGNGGDPTMEYEYYRSVMVQVMQANSDFYRSKLGINEYELDELLSRISGSRFLRDDKLEGISDLKESDVLAAFGVESRDKLFSVEGRNVSARNVTMVSRQGTSIDLIVVKKTEWDKLTPQVLPPNSITYFNYPKLQLIVHEQLGLLGKESTGDYSITQTFDTARLGRLPTLTEDGTPIQTLKVGKYAHTFDGSCDDARIRNQVAQTCRSWIDSELSDIKWDFFAFQCGFNGSRTNRTEQFESVEIVSYDVQVPGTVTYIPYTFATRNYYESSYYSVYSPGYTETVESPQRVTNYVNYCDVSGEIYLYGIDPKIEGYQSSRLLYPVSEDEKRDLKIESLSWQSEENVLEACYQKRLKVPREYVPNTRCVLIFDEKTKSWTYEIHGAIPFRSSVDFK